MLTSAILLRTVHKYSEIWQIPHFYEILREKIQDKDFNLFVWFLEKKHWNFLVYNTAVFFQRFIKKITFPNFMALLPN